MKKIIIFILLSTIIYVKGQGGGFSGPQITGGDPSVLPKIFPSSPEAYKLGSYGNIPVSLFTGTANVNIPLTDFKTSNLTLPIEMSYASNGVKIDDMNGSTGLGWNLITGGVITRTIRDLPDEDDNTNIFFPSNINVLGIRHPTVMQYLQDASNDLVDSEQDMYMASFNRNSIKFLFDRRGMPVVYSQKDVKIEGQSGGNSFTITMEDGIKYYFTDKETTNNRTVGDGHSLLTNNITAWYLTKIEDPSSGEHIIIENQNAGYSTTLSRSQIMKYTIGPPQHSSCGGSSFYLPPTVGELISHLQLVSGKQIKRIYSNNPNYGEIIFDYSLSNGNEDFQKLVRIQKKINTISINDINFDYMLTTNKRLFLNSINDVVSKAVHSFTYNTPEELPERLSFARDTGGYYNGINNNSLIPQLPTTAISYNGANQEVVSSKSRIGMLTKITYPTKGTSEFFYENNTTTVNKIIDPGQSGSLSMGAESTDVDFGSPNQTKSQTFTSIKDGEIMLGGGSSFNATKCPPELQVQGKHRAGVTLKRPNGEFIPFYTKSLNGSHIATGITHVLPISGTPFYAEVPKNELLTLSIKTSFECTRASVAVSWPISEAVWGDVQENTTGLRISKIIDNPESGVPVTRKFLYKDINGQSSNVIIARQPIFTENLNKFKTCIIPPPPSHYVSPIILGLEAFNYNALASSNINQLNASHPNMFYKTVQEVIEGKSIIVHNYSIDTDYFGKILFGIDIKSAPWTNSGWNNGREILTKYLDSNNNVVRTIENNYEEDDSRKIQVDGFAIRKNYDDPVTRNSSKTCKAEDLDDTVEVTVCTANHIHIWSTTDLYKSCHAIGAQNVTQIFNGLCYGKTVGDIVTFVDKLDNLDVVQYKNISRFDYLKSKKVTEYLNGTPVTSQTEYFYNNPSHHQLTNKKTINPDLIINESSFAYAHEKNNTKLINANMLGIPLETTVVKKQNASDAGKVISKTETRYDNPAHVFPTSVLSYDLQNPTTSSTELTYDQYDTKGNLQQYTTKSGVPTAIIWGYNQTQPIAKIEGAAYGQVSALAASIITASDTDASAVPGNDESQLLNILDTFRKDSTLAGFQITTYTYDPLIGVRSITPPSGIREAYIYDSANRLKEIRENDQAGKILKEFKYNYKN